MLVSPCEEPSRRQHRTHAVCSPDRCWVSTGLGTPERGRRPPRAKADVLEADLVPADLRDRPRPPHGRAQDQGMLPAHGRYEVSAKVRSLLQNEATFRGETPPVRSRHRRKMVAAPDVIETVHVPAAAERAVCTAAPLIASKLLLPLWWFAWRCPWRGGLRLGHWRRLGLGHRGGLGSHRLEWRRPRWLAWTRRVTRVWHGDSLLRNEHRRRGRRPDDLAELVVVFRVGQSPRWGEQQSGERRSPQHRSACPLSGSSLPLSRIPACGLLDRGRKRHTPLRSVIIQPERHQRGHRCGAGYLRPGWRLPSWRGMAPSTARSESR